MVVPIKMYCCVPGEGNLQMFWCLQLLSFCFASVFCQAGTAVVLPILFTEKD